MEDPQTSVPLCTMAKGNENKATQDDGQFPRTLAKGVRSKLVFPGGSSDERPEIWHPLSLLHDSTNPLHIVRRGLQPRQGVLMTEDSSQGAKRKGREGGRRDKGKGRLLCVWGMYTRHVVAPFIKE